MHRAYLFDFVGTPVDSMPTYVRVMLRILDEHQIPYGKDLVKVITPLGFVNTAKYFQELVLRLPGDKIIALMCQCDTFEYTKYIQAKANVINVLNALKARGADLNVLTTTGTNYCPCFLYSAITNSISVSRE